MGHVSVRYENDSTNELERSPYPQENIFKVKIHELTVSEAPEERGDEFPSMKMLSAFRGERSIICGFMDRNLNQKFLLYSRVKIWNYIRE